MHNKSEMSHQVFHRVVDKADAVWEGMGVELHGGKDSKDLSFEEIYLNRE
jgi:hypothetical protein